MAGALTGEGEREGKEVAAERDGLRPHAARLRGYLLPLALAGQVVRGDAGALTGLSLIHI